jgi:hypothetical protein
MAWISGSKLDLQVPVAPYVPLHRGICSAVSDQVVFTERTLGCRVGSQRLAGHRGVSRRTLSTVCRFPTAPLRTGRTPFSVSGSPVDQSFFVLALGITPTFTVTSLVRLSPFAMYQAFPDSDYYGDSVAIGVAPRRQSRIPYTVDVQDGLGAHFVPL